jgi:hypothetical protein
MCYLWAAVFSFFCAGGFAMSSPLEQAGATREPSEYATLSMDRGITGMWTQRSALRDADVPYLYGKFYSASRIDSIIDGINREISSRLTYRRRPGSSVYNSNTFPAINSFYGWSRINGGVEVIRVIADGADGTIYDATAGGKISIFAKSGGAGKARFQGVNTALFFTDGVENKKWLQPDTWVTQPSLTTTQYAIGTTVIDSNGKLQYLTKVAVGSITNVALTANTVALTFSPSGFGVVVGMSFSPAGLGAASFLNGQLLIADTVTPQGGNFVVTATFPFLPYASAADTGTASTRDVGTLATTGGIQPTWLTLVGQSTVDGISTWVNYGVPVYDWGVQAPLTPPVISTLPSQASYTSVALTLWQPNTIIGNATAAMMAVLDANGFIHSSLAFTSRSGSVYPNFQPASPVTQGSLFTTQDGQIPWSTSYWFGSVLGAAVGTGNAVILAQGPSSWVALFSPVTVGAPGGDVVLDSNGNLQMVTVSAGTGKSGATAPAWNATYGGLTTDGGLTWKNLGPYLAIAFRGDKYGYAYHCIDGSVSTLSPLTVSTRGSANGALVSGVGSTNPTCDSVQVYRTPDGQVTPLYLASIPNPGGNPFTLWDYYSDTELNAEEAGPQAHQNDAPPVGMTAPLYHLGRMWAIYKNFVICSGGPDTLVGNGNTAFPPLNAFPIPEQPIRLFSAMTNSGPGILAWCRANIYVILGEGTPTNPFKQAAKYMAHCGIVSYDAVTQVGSTFYAFGNTAKVNGNIVGKAFSLDPGAGYIEYGFPIGDQFENTTTGAGGKIPNVSAPTGYLYNPANAFVTWGELGSGDTALYVCDGSVGWFRHSPVASPESGFLWSPRAVIVGGTSAVQALETQPGVMQLLIGPASSGPILFRDSAVRTDVSGGVPTAYPSYDVKGCIQLCLSGEVGEVAHVHLVSAATGARPSVGLLFGEILASTAAPFFWYDRTSCEPPNLAPSVTIYSDRYSMLQKGVTPKCLFFQLGMDYGTQNFADETLMFSVYGAKYAERRQQ